MTPVSEGERRTAPRSAGPVLALDAMGVLYAAGDDVAELLIPFAGRNGTTAGTAAIESAYLDASLGLIDATIFWQRIGLDAGLEDEYLAGHRLIDGVHELLATAASVFGQICCISNDVPRWSVKLRRSFGIEELISPWFISGDLGVRKPDSDIYRQAIARLGVPAHHMIFVDDRVKNLDAARNLGIRTVLFDPKGVSADSTHRRIARLSDLPALVDTPNGRAPTLRPLA